MVLNWIGYIEYTESNVKKYITKSAGVYKIAVVKNNGELRVDYVGQSINLEERMLQHLSRNEENNELKNALEKFIYKINVAEVSTQASRDAVERSLYDHYEPQFNDPDAIPNVNPVAINFN